ncbi:MAG TPA: acetylglutamate kinase [Thermoanaerobaculia bacterium]|nr:acetylglutamate kinase [Thermoanaerobaculia bacterium]
MKDIGQRTTEIAGLRHAIPYVRLFRGRTFVIKLGGETLAEDHLLLPLLEQVEVLGQLGIHVVLVHGGGPQTTALATRLGLPTRIVDGRRVTDAATLEASVLALAGQANTRVLSAARRAGLAAVGLTGIDGNLLTASQRPPVTAANGELVDYGHVGDLEAVDIRLLARLAEAGFVPVIASLAAAADGAPLNVNADTVAAALAVALGAAKLILAVAVPGILERADDPHSVISLVDLPGLEALAAAGALSGGMLPKAAAIRQALAGGVPRVHVIPAGAPDALLAEVFTNEGVGTMVVANGAGTAP